MNSMGIDLSLTRTGVAWTESNAPQWDTIRSSPKDGSEAVRARQIADRIHVLIVVHEPRLAVVEAQSWGSKYRPNEGLRLMVAEILELEQIPVMPVAPASRIVFATGDGRKKEKKHVTAAVRKTVPGCPNHDVADALVLACMGLAKMHLPHPMGHLSERHTRALDKLKLPEIEPTRRTDTT